MLTQDTLSGVPKDTKQEEQVCECQKLGKAQSCEECRVSSQLLLDWHMQPDRPESNEGGVEILFKNSEEIALWFLYWIMRWSWLPNILRSNIW